MTTILVGSLRPESETKELINLGSSVNFAQDVLQGALVDGLLEYDENLKVLSSWPISPFPKVKKIFFKKKALSFKGKDGNYLYSGLINLPLINLLSRCIRTSKELKKLLEKGNNNNVIVYALHSPFLIATLLLKKRIRKTTLIVPDLPEYMGGSGGLVHRILKKFDRIIINFCVRRFDSFVLLSEPMKEKLPIGEKEYIVMEGIFKESMENSPSKKENETTLMYTGNLSRERQSIMPLIEAFDLINDPNMKLWIRGSGAMAKYISERAGDDDRITFFPTLSRAELLNYQKRATLMINPTPPTQEFTRYFFPSKIMEYLASGTPTIMHRLECMPPEYDSYIYYVDGSTVQDLQKKILEVASKSKTELDDFGQRARKFILEQKNPKVQCGRIYNLVCSSIN